MCVWGGRTWTQIDIETKRQSHRDSEKEMREKDPELLHLQSKNGRQSKIVKGQDS